MIEASVRMALGGHPFSDRNDTLSVGNLGSVGRELVGFPSERLVSLG